MSQAGDQDDGSAGIARGIMLTVIAIMIFGIQDVSAKILVEKYSPFQVTMLRYWGFAVFSVWLVSRQAPLAKAFSTKVPKLQLLRGVLLLADIWSFAFALRHVPLAELQAISLVYPLLVTILAALFLGEKVGPFRVGAVVVGFLGALIIVRPGGIPLDVGVLFAMMAATFYASYIVVTRKVAQFDTTATNMAFVSVIGMIGTTAVGFFFWQPIELFDLIYVGIVILTTVTAHTMMIEALRHAPASVVQPFNYLTLPWAIFLSFVVFGHLIDFVSFLGALVVAGAGLVVWWRERLKSRKAFVPRVRH